ncbi:MAG: alpha/beta fold hydrolase [Atribacterota bacterium]
MERLTISTIRIFIILFFSTFILLFFSLYTLAKQYEISKLLFDNSQFKTVEEIELHYRLWYPEEHLPAGNLLLLHGLGGSTFSWRSVAPDLAENGYLVLAVDLPGFGLSQRKPSINQSHNNKANLLWSLIENLDISGPWQIVGHSMGGGVGVAMVLQKPLNAESLTLVAGSISRNSNPIGKLISQSRVLRNLAGKFIERFFLTRKRIKSFLTSAYGREPTAEELEGYYRPLKLKNTYLTLTSLLRRYPSDKDLADKVDEITVPVLCLWGREDEWVPVSKGEELAEKIPNATLKIIDEARHCPMETHPEMFNEHLFEFLEEKQRILLAIK